MRLFGILLTVFNLAAAGAFVYLATQDWKGRQTITAAGVRHLLLLQGLPLEGQDFSAEDETPFVMEMGGGESTKTISKKLLESYFQANTAAPTSPTGSDTAAGGATTSKVPLATNTPVTNQIAEVKRVQALIKSELAKDAKPADKIALLRGWLLNQAENYETRLEYLALTSSTDPKTGLPKTDEQRKADATKLEAILDGRFAAVINPPAATESPLDAGNPGNPEKAAQIAAMSDKEKVEKSNAWRSGASLDTTQRRVNLAHLLIHLDPDAAWQKRIIAVVGLRRYVKAITNQVSRFTDMISHVELGIPGDQAAYVKVETQLREEAIRKSDRARAVAAELKIKRDQKTVADDAVNRQRTQLKLLTDELNKIKAEVDELLVRQSGIEKQLFEIQRVVGLTLEDVYRLEELLDATERERFGLPPQTKP
jgi:hypothetical protein